MAIIMPIEESIILNPRIQEEMDEINSAWLDGDQDTPIDTSLFFDVDCFSSFICCCFYNDPILTAVLKFFSLPSFNHILDRGGIWYLLAPFAIILDTCVLVTLILVFTVHQIVLILFILFCIIITTITCVITLGLPIWLYLYMSSRTRVNRFVGCIFVIFTCGLPLWIYILDRNRCTFLNLIDDDINYHQYEINIVDDTTSYNNSRKQLLEV